MGYIIDGYQFGDQPIEHGVNRIDRAFIGFNDTGKLFEAAPMAPTNNSSLAVGGWNGASTGTWRSVLANPTYSAALINELVAVCDPNDMGYKKYKGITLDWEYPSRNGYPEEANNFSNFCGVLQKHLHALNPACTLTVATPPGWMGQSDYEWSSLVNNVDFFQVIACDYSAGSHKVGPHADIGLSQMVINSMLTSPRLGPVPNHKILVGIPFYGQVWSNVQYAGGDPANRPGTPKGILSWSQIIKLIVDFTHPQNGWQIMRVPSSLNPNVHNYYYYNPMHEGGTMISCLPPQAIKEMTDFVQAKGLAGVFAWDMSHDDIKSTLMNTLIKELGDEGHHQERGRRTG